MTVKKTRKHCGFVIYSYFNHSAFTAAKIDVKFYSRCVKGVPFVNKRHTTGRGTFSVKKWYLKRGKRLNLGAEPPSIKLC